MSEIEANVNEESASGDLDQEVQPESPAQADAADPDVTGQGVPSGTPEEAAEPEGQAGEDNAPPEAAVPSAEEREPLQGGRELETTAPPAAAPSPPEMPAVLREIAEDPDTRTAEVPLVLLRKLGDVHTMRPQDRRDLAASFRWLAEQAEGQDREA